VTVPSTAAFTLEGTPSSTAGVAEVAAGAAGAPAQATTPCPGRGCRRGRRDLLDRPLVLAAAAREVVRGLDLCRVVGEKHRPSRGRSGEEEESDHEGPETHELIGSYPVGHERRSAVRPLVELTSSFTAQGDHPDSKHHAECKHDSAAHEEDHGRRLRPGLLPILAIGRCPTDLDRRAVAGGAGRGTLRAGPGGKFLHGGLEPCNRSGYPANGADPANQGGVAPTSPALLVGLSGREGREDVDVAKNAQGQYQRNDTQRAGNQSHDLLPRLTCPNGYGRIIASARLVKGRSRPGSAGKA
jgi:hypothetical protein